MTLNRISKVGGALGILVAVAAGAFTAGAGTRQRLAAIDLVEAHADSIRSHGVRITSVERLVAEQREFIRMWRCVTEADLKGGRALDCLETPERAR